MSNRANVRTGPSHSLYAGTEILKKVFETVAFVEYLSDDGVREVHVDGRDIALFRIDDAYYALNNACKHQNGPLCADEIDNGEVECPWHGARFELETGAAKLCSHPRG